ncbi:MAG: hypothetical protein WDZ63_01160 [Burkholderiales bacterium]
MFLGARVGVVAFRWWLAIFCPPRFGLDLLADALDRLAGPAADLFADGGRRLADFLSGGLEVFSRLTHCALELAFFVSQSVAGICTEPDKDRQKQS